MRHPLPFGAVTLTILCLGADASAGLQLSGFVLEASGGAPIPGARVTIVSAAGAYVDETRSAGDGAYSFQPVADGTYTAGASAPEHEYVEQSVVIGPAPAQLDFSLGAETEPGRWDIIGDPGERFGGTNSALLLPNGRVMYCHDTRDPRVYDPATNVITTPAQSQSIQGCHAVSLLQNGRVIYVGGTNQEVYGPGTRQVKSYDPTTDTWRIERDMTDYRWYPTMVQLPDGEILAAGGGGLQNPRRVNTTEVLDPRAMTWTRAGTIAIGNEVSPVALLFTGEVLMTHRPPQLYNPSTRRWRRARDFLQGNRMANGDHADHELVLLGDGRVVALGFKSFDRHVPGNLTEIYDPQLDRWTVGASFAPVRSRASVVHMPDGKILLVGGYKEDQADPTPVNAWGYMWLTDQYDAARNSWRRLAALNIAREYHATPVLVPDGRVIIVAGEGSPGVEPAMSTIEAFTPPYLLRGVRPEISNISTTQLARGTDVGFDIGGTRAPTRVILISTIARTHFQDSGNQRYLELPFTQAGARITATIPSDPARAVVGFYLLFALVDDIPSQGQIVQIIGPTGLKGCSVQAVDASWLTVALALIALGVARRRRGARR